VNSGKTEKSKNPVIVVGGGLTALGMLRAFGERGIDVYLITDKNDTACYSKFCKRSFAATGLRSNRSILKSLLNNIGKTLSKRAVIYPTSDLNTLNLAELKDELPDDYCFVVGDKEPVKILVNKGKFYRALAQSGINYPKTYFPETIKDAKIIGGQVKYPVFIRPAITQLFSHAFTTSTKGFKAHSSRELMKFYSLSMKHGIEVMFQEIIPGPPTNSYQLEGYYDINYKPKILFARQRLRIWPPDFGNTTLCVSIPISELDSEKNKVNQFIKDIGYNGLASAEFKKDNRDGVLKLLEINARPWWHFWLSKACGADIIFVSYLNAIGEKTEYTEQYKIGIKSTFFVHDVMAAGKMMLTKNIRMSEWVSSLAGIRQFAFLSKKDPTPFFMELVAKDFPLAHKMIFSGKNQRLNGQAAGI